MRIRTLKPEFWKHHGMSQLPAETRLLAIGLLNFADDEGYFSAHPALIRGELMPFEEKTKQIPAMLKALEGIGYVTLTEGADGLPLGRITNFIKHQRINRPTKSKYSRKTHTQLSESSVSPHGVLTEDSAQERNREQGREEEQGGEGKGSAADAAPDAPPHPEDDPAAQSRTGILPEKKEGGRAAPANVEEALAYAEAYSKGNTEMLIIEDAWVRDWHAERESVGWMKVSGGVQVPITDWRADLLRWSRREKQYPRPEAAKKEGGTELVVVKHEAVPARFAEAWLELYGTELPAWAMLGEGEKSEVRRWIATNGKEAA